MKDRRIVILGGSASQATSWAESKDIALANVWCVAKPRQLLHFDPATTHLVIMPGYWDLPNHSLYKVEVEMMHRKGATLEWV